MVKKVNFLYKILKKIQLNNYLDDTFSNLTSCLIKFLEDFITLDRIDKDLICEDLPNTSVACDYLEFNNPSQVIAYVILHFLSRYRRSQTLFLELLENRHFPISLGKNRVISIGAGPSPALYAVNNVYTTLNRILEAKYENQTKISYQLDYCEISHNFRQFLHHFTEFLNSERLCGENDFYSIPYHFGSFGDFSEMEVSKNDNIRFEIAIFNNFLTPNTRFEDFKSNIKGVIECITKNGLLVIFGPDLKGKSNYIDYYLKLNKFLADYKYKTKTRRTGYLNQVIFYESELTRFNKQSLEAVRSFYSFILKILTPSSKLGEDFKKQFINKSRENPKIKDKWSAMIFQKEYRK